MDPVEIAAVKAVVAKAITDPAKLAEVNTAIDAVPPAPVAEPAAEVTAAEGVRMPWLKTRLDRAKETARKEVFTTLGVDSVEVAKEIITKHRTQADANKTTEQKLADAVKERDAFKADNERFATGTKTRLEILTKGLTEEQKTIIPNLPDTDKLPWLENAITRGVFGKPASANPDTKPDSKPNAEFTAALIPATAPGLVVKEGKQFVSRAWIGSLSPIDFRKYEKDIDAAMKSGRIVP